MIFSLKKYFNVLDFKFHLKIYLQEYEEDEDINISKLFLSNKIKDLKISEYFTNEKKSIVLFIIMNHF